MYQFTLNEKIRKTRQRFDDENVGKKISDKQRQQNRKEKQQSRYAGLTGETY